MQPHFLPPVRKGRRLPVFTGKLSPEDTIVPSCPPGGSAMLFSCFFPALPHRHPASPSASTKAVLGKSVTCSCVSRPGIRPPAPARCRPSHDSRLPAHCPAFSPGSTSGWSSLLFFLPTWQTNSHPAAVCLPPELIERLSVRSPFLSGCPTPLPPSSASISSYCLKRQHHGTFRQLCGPIAYNRIHKRRSLSQKMTPAARISQRFQPFQRCAAGWFSFRYQHLAVKPSLPPKAPPLLCLFLR